MIDPRANAMEIALLDLVEAGYLHLDTASIDRIRVRVESKFPIVEPDRVGYGSLGAPAGALYARVVAAHAAGHPYITLLDLSRERRDQARGDTA